jgi:hypothetical protein
MRFVPLYLRPLMLGALACTALVCCSMFDQKKDEPKVDPNLFPTDYKAKIITFLKTYLSERSAYSGALISSPVLKPFGTENRYVVCVRLVNGSKVGEKMATFFGGQLNQFVDADQSACTGAAYAPFVELESR